MNGTAQVRATAVEQAVARLTRDFAERVPAAAVRDTVVRGSRELAGAPDGALPELVERLARERLATAYGTATARADRTPAPPEQSSPAPPSPALPPRRRRR